MNKESSPISRRTALKYIVSGVAAGAILISGAGILHRSGKMPAGKKNTGNTKSEGIRLTIDANSPGHRIPADFAGLSFEVGPLISGNAGVNGYLFSPENSQLITLFKNIGIKHLRVGGEGRLTSGSPSVPGRKVMPGLTSCLHSLRRPMRECSTPFGCSTRPRVQSPT